MRLTDSNGEELGYLPISLDAGEESAILTLLATPEAPGEALVSSYSPEVIIAGRIAGAGAFLDLFVAPLDLSGYYGATVAVEIKVVANEDVVGVRRVGQFVGVASGSGAGWLL